MNKYLQVLDQLPMLKAIVVYGKSFENKPHDIVMSWNEFMALGDRESGRSQSYAEMVNERIEKQVPGKC